MKIHFDENAKSNEVVQQQVNELLAQVETMEAKLSMPVVIFQDGVQGSYYIKCSILAINAGELCDLNAKLDISKAGSYRANRQLLLRHETYKKMVSDSSSGREFNDIIVEYNTQYNEESPLKVWGGQHRISAIKSGGQTKNRYHGFRIYFNLSKKQRTEVALISNTNISVSNDTFDRMVEETIFGDGLRNWCQLVGFLDIDEDFPDAASTSEKITVKRTRSFIVNFYLGKERGNNLTSNELDKNVYEPYLSTTGVTMDTTYENTMRANNVLQDRERLEAGQKFLLLHKAQSTAVKSKTTKIRAQRRTGIKLLLSQS